MVRKNDFLIRVLVAFGLSLALYSVGVVPRGGNTIARAVPVIAESAKSIPCPGR